MQMALEPVSVDTELQLSSSVEGGKQHKSVCSVFLITGDAKISHWCSQHDGKQEKRK